MENEIYDDFALEKIVKAKFGLNIDVSQVIARQIDVGQTTKATVFLTSKKQLFVFVNSHTKLVLSDVKKIVSRMGLKPELYFPPKGQIDYFDMIGRQKFQEVFPGRGHVSSDDIIFYRTLAPYNPALVQIQEVKNGEIMQYDSDSAGKWRISVKFAYRRIRTS